MANKKKKKPAVAKKKLTKKVKSKKTVKPAAKAKKAKKTSKTKTNTKKVLPKVAKKKVAPKAKAKAKPKAAIKKVTMKATAKSSKKTPVKLSPVKSTAKKIPAKLNKLKVVSKLGTQKINIDWEKYFSPLDDRLIVEVGEEAKVTSGGIIIPDSVEEKPISGLVLAAGRGHQSIKGKVRPMDVKVGDKVIYSKYSGTPVEIEGKNVLILREGDILGIAIS